MTREEILEKRRKESSGMDEWEMRTKQKANDISMGIGLLLCLLVVMLNLACDGPDAVHFSAWLIYWGSYCVSYWYQAVTLKKKTDLLMAVLSTVSFILYACCFISETIGA